MISKENFQEFADFVNLLYSPRAYVKRQGYENPTFSLSSPKEYVCFAYLIERLGLSKKPVVVTDEAYLNIPARNFYRGLSSYIHLKELVCGDEYHYGSGNTADGLFFSPREVIAQRYGNAVLEAKVESSAVIEDWADVARVGYALKLENPEDLNPKQKRFYTEIVSLLETLDPDTKPLRLLNVITNNYAVLAMLLGIDGLTIDKNLCLFNRGKLIVSESEYNSIAEISENKKEN